MMVSSHVPLALGAMNFGKRTPEDEAKRIVHRALDAGITVFDTANAYNDGESERILGRLLAGAGVRDKVEIATKVGFGRIQGKPEGLSPERVLAAIDESLQRLGTDRVDIYYLHVPDHRVPIDATLTAVKKVLDSGKARSWGVSNYASWQILQMNVYAERMEMPKPRIAQQMYNALVRQLDIEYFAFARQYELHTTVYNPLAGGLLTGKPGKRFESNAMYQRRYLSKTMQAATLKLGAIASEAGLSLVTLAYRWIVGRSGVDSVLVGPGTLEHLDAALASCTSPLDPETAKKVDEVWLEMNGTDATYAR